MKFYLARHGSEPDSYWSTIVETGGLEAAKALWKFQLVSIFEIDSSELRHVLDIVPGDRAKALAEARARLETLDTETLAALGRGYLVATEPRGGGA